MSTAFHSIWCCWSRKFLRIAFGKQPTLLLCDRYFWVYDSLLGWVSRCYVYVVCFDDTFTSQIMLPWALVLWVVAKFSAILSTPFYSRTIDYYTHDCRRGCPRFVTGFTGTTELIWCNLPQFLFEHFWIGQPQFLKHLSLLTNAHPIALQLEQLWSGQSVGHASCTNISLICTSQSITYSICKQVVIGFFCWKILSILKQHSPCLGSPRSQYQR